MGATRPTDSEPTQEQQAELLTESGNEPTVADEAQLLADLYGQPDADGVYGAPADEGRAA